MNKSNATLESLAANVVTNVALLAYRLGAEGLVKPTLEESGHTGYSGESLALRQARYDLARAAKSLLLLAQGPEDTALSLMWSGIDAANMDILVRFGFFSAVPLSIDSHVPSSVTAEISTGNDQSDVSNGVSVTKNGASSVLNGISIDDLAIKVDLPAGLTGRMIRFAIGNGLFAESAPGVFVHSATSAALARSPELCAVGRMASGPLTSMVVRTADALELQQAQRRGNPKTLLSGQSELGSEDSAFCLAFPGHTGPFELAKANKEFAEIGHAFMRDQSSTSRMKIEHLLTARDWSDASKARIVDVGGSLGHASIALASVLPRASFIVQDIGTIALDQGRGFISRQLPHLVDRISFEQHDFFTPMPTSTAGDFFLLQWILHDWNDADAKRIIQNLVPGMKPGARVLIAEAIRPAPPAQLANTLDEKLVFYQDMTMLAAHNARERSIAEFVDLFAEADPRFHHVFTGGGINGAYRSLLEFEFRA